MTMAWVRRARISSTRHSSTASAPSSRGAPVLADAPGARREAVGAAAEKRRATGSCASLRKFNENSAHWRNRRKVEPSRCRLTISDGGVSDSEATAVATQPARPEPSPQATMATPVAKARIARR